MRRHARGHRACRRLAARPHGLLVTCFDVVARKFGIELPYTKLQELEWHFHAALFSLWMGYYYTINAHPRVDSYTERLTHRARRGSSSSAA